MATYWVRADGGGSDAAAGTSYAVAFATIGHAFNVVSQGDTLRLVNDGDHTAPGFTDALLLQSLFAGTNYTTDPGLIIEGVDASGDPALATLVATDGSNTYLFSNANSQAKYIWLRGIKFDWSYYGANAATTRYPITGSTIPEYIKFTDCFFDFGALGTTLSADTSWNPLGGITASGSQAGQACTFEVSYCVFRNAVLGMPNVGYVSNLVHHCIFHQEAANHSAGIILTGGDFYKDTRDNTYYNNTIIMKKIGTAEVSALFSIKNADTDKMSAYNNVVYADVSNTTSAGTINSVLRSSDTNADKEAAAQMDYDVFAFGPKLDIPTTFGGAGGFGSHAFCELWRAGSTTFLCTSVPTNSVEITNTEYTDLFSSTSAWTWTTPSGYAIDVDWDYRIIQQRTSGLAGAVPGAVTESVNTTPTAGPVTYSVTAGNVIVVSATLGVLSNSSDPDGDTLSATVTTNVTHGAIASFNTTTGAFEYTPNPTYAGVDFFNFQISDGAETDNSTATITVDAYPVVPPVDPVPIDNLIDTAPFFRPVLELDAIIKYQGKRNRKLKQDLRRYDEDVLWEESVHRYFNLATNTTQQITLGGVSSAQYLVVETDQDISVSINSATHFVPVDGVLGILNTAVTSLYVKNDSTTNTARVVILAVD